MRHIGFLFVAVALASGAPEQKVGTPSPNLEIHGVVLEYGTNQPIIDAAVALYVDEPDGASHQDEGRNARTDYRGAFTLQLEKPGGYGVRAYKPGFARSDVSGVSDYADVTLSVEKPIAEVKLFLVRPGQLTGSVVDEETRKPIANLRLRAVRKRGPLEFMPAGLTPSKTDAEGQFVATGLPPGEYAVVIGSQTEPNKRVLTEFTAQDVKTVELDYEQTYWPGGHGPEAVLPVTVASGATAYMGQLEVRKVPYHRVHIQISFSNCADGDTVRVAEAARTFEWMDSQPQARVPCGKDVLVTGLAPGHHLLTLSGESRTGETRGKALVQFTIADENLELAATLTPGVPLEGAVVAAEGAKPPDFAKVEISLNPAGGRFQSDAKPAVPDADGKFRFADVRLVGQGVSVFGLGPASYVKEMRYNGIPLSGDTIPLDRTAIAHELTIVTDDKAGTIVGAVVSGGKPVSRPIVIARRWPRNDQLPFALASASGDDTGRFELGGLAPGQYRIIAFQPRDLLLTSVIEEALAAGKEIEIGPSGLQIVILEPAELR